MAWKSVPSGDGALRCLADLVDLLCCGPGSTLYWCRIGGFAHIERYVAGSAKAMADQIGAVEAGARQQVGRRYRSLTAPPVSAFHCRSHRITHLQPHRGPALLPRHAPGPACDRRSPRRSSNRPSSRPRASAAVGVIAAQQTRRYCATAGEHADSGGPRNKIFR